MCSPSSGKAGQIGGSAWRHGGISVSLTAWVLYPQSLWCPPVAKVSGWVSGRPPGHLGTRLTGAFAFSEASSLPRAQARERRWRNHALIFQLRRWPSDVVSLSPAENPRRKPTTHLKGLCFGKVLGGWWSRVTGVERLNRWRKAACSGLAGSARRQSWVWERCRPGCGLEIEPVSSVGAFYSFGSGGSCLFCLMSESLSRKREGSQDNAIHKREVYYWLESGLSAATNAVVQGQKSLKQRLLAKFIRYA